MQRICKYLSVAYSLGRFLRLKVSQPVIDLFFRSCFAICNHFCIKIRTLPKKDLLACAFCGCFFFSYRSAQVEFSKLFTFRSDIILSVLLGSKIYKPERSI